MPRARDLAKQFPRGLAEPDAIRLRRPVPPLWEYYLAYCEAGFLSGNIDVRQVVFAKAKYSPVWASVKRFTFAGPL